MTDFLEELKTRLLDAQKRLQAAQQEMQAVQAKYQTVAQEAGSLQLLVSVETAKRQSHAAPGDAPTETVPKVPPTQTALPQAAETNKTERIRELLRQHPAGMTPTEIWKQVKTQMAHRAYLYSVLKRLKDKDEVIVRRGKYFAKIMPKPEEAREQTLVQ